GVELAQAFARLGSKVTVIEAGPTFLGLEEPEAGMALRPHLEGDGITILLGDAAERVDKGGVGVVVKLKSGKSVTGERLLVAPAAARTSRPGATPASRAPSVAG